MVGYPPAEDYLGLLWMVAVRALPGHVHGARISREILRPRHTVRGNVPAPALGRLARIFNPKSRDKYPQVATTIQRCLVA